MRAPSTTTGKVLATAAAPVAMLAAAALIWQSSNAAFSGTTRNSGNNWATGAVSITDDDSGSARFQVENMTPGDTDTKCIKVTTNANVPGIVKGYAVNPVTSPSGLEDHIWVTVRYGDGGGFGSCDGFTSLGTSIPHLNLSTLATFNSYEAAVGGWNVTAGTQSRTYEITWHFDTDGMTQNEIDQLQGNSTGIDFQWELQST
jgi:hypothetical protein